MTEKTTAAYRVISDAGGNRYRFFCGLSGVVACTTGPIRADTPEEDLRLAWQEGRRHFNMCWECGRWVIDTMYNMDEAKCVDCAPWLPEPVYCEECGAKLRLNENYCRSCGWKIPKTGVDAYDE